MLLIAAYKFKDALIGIFNKLKPATAQPVSTDVVTLDPTVINLPTDTTTVETPPFNPNPLDSDVIMDGRTNCVECR